MPLVTICDWRFDLFVITFKCGVGVGRSCYGAEDTRQDYGEARYTAFGLINGRLRCVYFTIRGDNYRIIGLRKANNGEIERYGQETDTAH